MFRIKPTRNQTTAKHVNLSPYPNNNLLFNTKVQINNVQNANQFNQSKKQTKTPSKTNLPNMINNPKLNPNFHVTKRPNNPKIPIKEVLNPQKTTKQSINPTNKNQPNKITFIKTPKPNQQRNLLKRPSNHNQHKLKLNPTQKVSQIRPKQNLKTKKINQNPHQQEKISVENLLNQKSESLEVPQTLNITQPVQINKNAQIKQQIIQNLQNLETFKQTQKNQEKIQENSDNFQSKPAQYLSSPKIQKVQEKPQKLLIQQTTIKQEKQKQQNDKEKQMQDLMLKIQKRRQARQQQKRRIRQMQEKRKQNQQRALQFMNQRNRNNQGFDGLTGMLKLNDQLMHFSLAQSIMDLQIKKLLKTNFDDFPNSSQIKYQIEELQRINMSYEIVRLDENNPLKNGLMNYRVQIFNRIGEEIMRAQQQGYSNPNFHIMEHDGRINQGQNSVIPQAIRGLPKESQEMFIKYVKNYQEQECTICLGEINLGQTMAKLECGHNFHQKCIKEWVESSANCPTCRFNIKFGSKRV